MKNKNNLEEISVKDDVLKLLGFIAPGLSAMTKLFIFGYIMDSSPEVFSNYHHLTSYLMISGAIDAGA